MKFLSGKDVYYKTFIVGIMFSIVTLILTAPFFFFSLKEIPLGLFVGILFNIIFFIFLSNFGKRKMPITIVIIVIRFILFAGLLVLSGFMFYKWDMKLFHPVTLTVGYVIGTFIYVVMLLKEGKNDL